MHTTLSEMFHRLVRAEARTRAARSVAPPVDLFAERAEQRIASVSPA